MSDFYVEPSHTVYTHQTCILRKWAWKQSLVGTAEHHACFYLWRNPCIYRVRFHLVTGITLLLPGFTLDFFLHFVSYICGGLRSKSREVCPLLSFSSLVGVSLGVNVDKVGAWEHGTTCEGEHARWTHGGWRAIGDTREIRWLVSPRSRPGKAW